MVKVEVHISNQSTCKVETGRSGVQRHPQKHVPGKVKLNLSIERNKKILVFFYSLEYSVF